MAIYLFCNIIRGNEIFINVNDPLKITLMVFKQKVVIVDKQKVVIYGRIH